VRLSALRTAFFAPGNDPSAWLDGWYPATHRCQVASTESENWRTAGTSAVLDLQGERDRWRPPGTRAELREELGSRVTTVVIPGAAHALLPERPADVVAAVVDWIREI
jgi:pimeloyl-ACP methyl ester carboxylesterase